MSKTIIAVIAVAVVSFGGYLFLKGINKAPSVVQLVQQQPTADGKIATYTDTGFSPGTLTIKQGDVVIFKNMTSLKFGILRYI